MEKLLRDLNPEQQDACLYGEGPLLIFAGAGSGKTRVLTYRVACLIASRRAQPWQILAVTFTNKAANELKHRLEKLLSPEVASKLWAGTFHSICARLLRMEGQAIGVQPEFVIYDEAEKLTALKQALRELNLDSKQFEPKPLAWRISEAKNELLSPVKFTELASDFYDKLVARVYKQYQKVLERNGALDFDDLILKAVELLQQNEEVRTKYGERFRYVLVDEFQDINQAQYELVKLLSSVHRNLAVVGDDDQSIYRWRGADVRLMLEFEKDFPDAHVVKLEQNYRSTQPILEAAWRVISRNKQRAPKKLWSERASSEPVVVYEAVDGTDEASFVLQTIQEAVSAGEAKYSDFAVLFRTNAQSREFEEQFLRWRIPYRLVGGFRFYDRKEIKDAVAYLRLAYNERDDVSYERIVNVPPRGLGKQTLELVAAEASERNLARLEAARLLVKADSPLSSRARKALAAFVDLVDEIKQELAKDASPAKLVRFVLQCTGYAQWLREQHSSEAEERLENLAELENVARQFEEGNPGAGLAGFLEHLALMTDLDRTDAGPDRVWLMTLHSAKGLEFKYVFMVGMEEGLCPHLRSLDDPQGIEEERRLCYVGMTRAKDRLYVTYAGRRMLFGRTQPCAPSRFLAEIPEELLERQGGRSGGDPALLGLRTRPAGRKLDLRSVLGKSSTLKVASKGRANVVTGRPTQAKVEPEPEHPFRAGMSVSHPKFGKGKVVQVRGDVVSVAFPGQGIKKLSAEYAPLSLEGG